MATPSVTLRTVQNEATGIDICAPSIYEEEAPLGGTSVLYEISVLTTLEIFKNKLHKSDDVVHFSIFKAYREVEDFYNKIKKKFPFVSLPIIPATTSKGKLSQDEKLNSINTLMKAISENIDICNCTTFTQFIGISSIKPSSISTTENELEKRRVEAKEEQMSDIFQDTQNVDDNIEDSVKVVLDFGKKLESEKVIDEDLSDVFPKMKTTESKTKSEQVKKSVPKVSNKSSAQNIDLFQEVKLVKEIEKAGIAAKKTVSQGLFDDFEDDNLFSSKPSTITNVKKKNSAKVVEKKDEDNGNVREKSKMSSETKLDDKIGDEIIIKDRKIGEVSLFQSQDLGDYITKEEESLFFVSEVNKKEAKKNKLLFSDEEDPTLTLKEVSDDNLDDLLNLDNLPIFSTEKPTEKAPSAVASERVGAVASGTEIAVAPETANAVASDKVDAPAVEEEEPTKAPLPPRPLPRPRKKSLEPAEQPKKPEVLPRNVYLNNPPPVAAKPMVPPKPKPKPPAKKPSLVAETRNNPPTDQRLPSINANEQPEVNRNIISNVTDDLDKLDILKYIEQEEKQASAQTSLFD